MYNSDPQKPPVLPSQVVKSDPAPSYPYGGGPADFFTSLSTDTVRRGIAASYAWMALGLLLSAAVAILSYATSLWTVLYQVPFLALVLLIAQLGVTIGFTAKLNTGSLTTLRVMFLAYAALTGFNFSMILAAYGQGLVFSAFAISALYYGCLCLIGFTTKINFEKIGPVLIVGLILLLVSQLLMMLFRVPEMVRVYSFIGLLLFTGITIWDTQRMKKIMAAAAGDDAATDRFSIYFALQLYLDFINIFLFILRLLNAGSGSNRR